MTEQIKIMDRILKACDSKGDNHWEIKGGRITTRNMLPWSKNPLFMSSYHHKLCGVESLFVRVVSHLFFIVPCRKKHLHPQHEKERKILFATIKRLLEIPWNFPNKSFKMLFLTLCQFFIWFVQLFAVIVGNCDVCYGWA
jgi:hypothetical protein